MQYIEYVNEKDMIGPVCISKIAVKTVSSEATYW